MSIGVMTLIMCGALLLLIATGFPVAFGLLVVSVIGIYVWISPGALNLIASVTFTTSVVDYLIAVPMFTFMACVLQVSGLATALYEMMYKWMAGLRGGLAMGTVGIGTIMAATTGASSTATIAMGLLAYPEMKSRGYHKTISVGCCPAGGVLGPLIPPSIPMIIVASFGSLSIGKLFMAGVFPGLLTSLLFMSYIGIRCLRSPALGPPIPLADRVNWKEKFISLGGAGLPVLLIILVLGTIYAGIATPSEAGGIGAFGAVICAAVYRNLTLKNIKSALITTLKINSMVFMLIITGSCFSSLLGITGVTDFVAAFITGLELNRWLVLGVMMGILIAMGMFMDAVPITVISLPIFMPIARALGFDDLWFGLIYTIGLLIGFLTPPFGMAMFYFKGLGYPEITMMDIYRSCLPYVGLFIVAWIIVTIFPPVATWLPSMMIKGGGG